MKNLIISIFAVYIITSVIYFYTFELRIQQLENNVRNLTELSGKLTDVDKIVYEKMFLLTNASNAYHDILDSMLTHEIKKK
jgi:hypothetical protein